MLLHITCVLAQPDIVLLLLLHNSHFPSSVAFHRSDEYGGSLENRMRFPLAIASAVRATLPPELPLLVRISGTDYTPGGWDVEQSVQFCKELKEIGVDLIDCSSGGAVPYAKIKAGPGYQVPIATAVKKGAGEGGRCWGGAEGGGSAELQDILENGESYWGAYCYGCENEGRRGGRSRGQVRRGGGAVGRAGKGEEQDGKGIGEH